MALTKATAADIFTVAVTEPGKASFPYQTTDEAAARALFAERKAALLAAGTDFMLTLSNDGTILAHVEITTYESN